MINNDALMIALVMEINEKMLSITNEVTNREKSYAYYIDEKLKNIEWDIRILRNKVNEALEKEKEG